MRRHPQWTGTTRARRALLLAALSLTSIGGAMVAEPAAAASRPAPIPVAVAALAEVRGDATAALGLLSELRGVDSTSLRGELAVVRDRLATVAATAVGGPATAMRTAWAKADDRHLTALMAAITQIGVPYRHFESEPGQGFDCSGLTSWAWAVAGVTIDHQSGAQIDAAAGRNVFTAQAGDLVYYPGHVMLYLGVDNFVIHAPYSGEVVSFDTTSWHGGRLRFGDPSR